MKFNKGAEVYTADEKKLGHLSQVVMNPHTKHVTDIVVHKGYFFTTDKVIPVKDIQQTLDTRITLHAGAEVAAYPDFTETQFLPLLGDDEAAADAPSPVLWYPPLRIAVYNPLVPEAPYVVHETEHIPPGTRALAIGSEVITSDGDRVGRVKEVFMDSVTGESTHFLISNTEGTFLPGEKLVPTNWIRLIDANEIHLSVATDMMMSLPDYNRQE